MVYLNPTIGVISSCFLLDGLQYLDSFFLYFVIQFCIFSRIQRCSSRYVPISHDIVTNIFHRKNGLTPMIITMEKFSGCPFISEFR